MYDYLIVGSGLFGSVFAYEANKRGKKCLVLEKREHIGGNIYTEEIEGIQVHKYGAHIFHTSNKEVWEFVNQFAEFNHYINSPIAIYKNELYNLPFNMNTFNKMWGVKTPDEAIKMIDEQRGEYAGIKPGNLEEQALALVGKDIYEKLIKGYTEKQWGKACSDLPAFIIRRIPLRFTFNNNYFNDLYQGIPVGGYTKMIHNMLDGIEVKTGLDFFDIKDKCMQLARKVIFTGMIDEFYQYQLGELEYRSLDFETEILECRNYQGNAVVNYTEREIPYTRIIEHKHFEFGAQEKTVITKEYPKSWKRNQEPYYPVNDGKNNQLFEKYKNMSKMQDKVIFGGRLGSYRYYDMDKVIEEAQILAAKEIS